MLRLLHNFAPSLQEHLRDPQLPSIAIITSQAAQYSAFSDFQLAAQQRAVRTLAYDVHLPSYVVAENQIDKLGSPTLAILPSPQALGEAAWRALLNYADAGGSLLITGPVDRDQHWQIVPRAAELGLAAHVAPLTYHDATIRLGDRSLRFAFNEQDQNWLDSLRFEDGSTFKEIPHGQGRIFWASYPVELSDGAQPVADLYAYVANRLNIAPMFNQQSLLPPGVLVFPTLLADSVLYVFISDSAHDSAISLRDQTTGAQIAFSLPAEHAAIAVIGKKEKKIVAKYGF